MNQNENKHTLLSTLFLLFSFLTLFSESFFADISENLSPTNAFDWFIFKTFGVLFASNYIFLVPYILAGIFLIFSVYFGIKAIRQTETGFNRWLAIVSTTTAIFVLALVFFSVVS